MHAYNCLCEMVCYFILRHMTTDRNTSPSTEEVKDTMDARGLKAEVVEHGRGYGKKLQAQLHRSLRSRQLTAESLTHED
jgi:hypothetical protein